MVDNNNINGIIEMHSINEKNNINSSKVSNIFIESLPDFEKIDLLYKNKMDQAEIFYNKIRNYFESIYNFYDVKTNFDKNYVHNSLIRISNHGNYVCLNYMNLDNNYGILIHACINNIIKKEIKMQELRYIQIKKLFSEDILSIFDSFKRIHIGNFQKEVIFVKLKNIIEEVNKSYITKKIDLK